MEIADVFLVLGEKVQELIESKNAAFFNYSGHVNKFDFTVYKGKWGKSKKPEISFYQKYSEPNGDYVQRCLNASNLLMLK